MLACAARPRLLVGLVLLCVVGVAGCGPSIADLETQLQVEVAELARRQAALDKFNAEMMAEMSKATSPILGAKVPPPEKREGEPFEEYEARFDENLKKTWDERSAEMERRREAVLAKRTPEGKKLQAARDEQQSRVARAQAALEAAR